MTSKTQIILHSGCATEYEIFKFSVEASELGLAPGVWPETIETSMGNKQPLRYAYTDANGERVYTQPFGCINVTVIND